MSDKVPLPVAGGSGEPSVNLRCERCGEAGRVHPGEPYLDQVRMWLAQHRHDGAGGV